MGLGADKNAWFLQVKEFKKYFLVIALDNRGTGESDKPDTDFTIMDMADDTISLMDHLCINKSHILGTSMGGEIAQGIAINYPERVNRLVLASTLYSGSAMEKYTKENFSNVDAYKDIENMDVEKYFKELVSLSFNIEESDIYVQMSNDYIKLVGTEVLKKHIKASACFETEDRLHLINARTLVLTGTEDRVVPPRFSEVLSDRIKDSVLIKIENGSHAVNLEMSDVFNKKVLDFLTD